MGDTERAIDVKLGYRCIGPCNPQWQRVIFSETAYRWSLRALQ